MDQGLKLERALSYFNAAFKPELNTGLKFVLLVLNEWRILGAVQGSVPRFLLKKDFF